ncbi:MAG: cell wall hydrolase [Desulfotomaculaceae bacterium]|nr:cell wall hydrolase [Desulfotomaculaceae bacterium]
MKLKKIIAGFIISLSVIGIMPPSSSFGAESTYIKTNYISTARGLSITREEFMLLAKLINAEARGETLIGQVAVGAVVFNRLKDPRYPKTIAKVIYDKDQFSPVTDGSIDLQPNEESLLAAELAFNGLDPTNGCLFFYNPAKVESDWIDKIPGVVVIGSHVFG